MTKTDLASEAHTLPTLTTEQVAELIGTTVDNVRIMRRRGTGPRYYRRSHKVVRYARADVIAWMTANPVDPEV